MTRTEKRLLVGLVIIGGVGLIVSAALAAGLLWTYMRANVSTTAQSPASVRATVTRVMTSAQPAAGTASQSLRPAVSSVPRQELPLPAAQTAAGADLTQLYEQVAPGVVSIEVHLTVASPFGGGGFSQEGAGSGFVIDNQHVVTNNHVVGGADSVEVVFDDLARRSATLVATDEYTDLAVLKVEDMPASARSLPLLESFSDLAVGQPVVALGNPFGKKQTMTYGIVSALGRVIPSGATQFSIPQAIQTDAAINPGNSGGPLLDLRGRVIGVNAQIDTTNNAAGSIPGNSGVGFAIPASIVAKVVPDLLSKGRHDWSYLGVTGMSDITLDIAKANNLKDTRGAYITSVVSGGPSDGKLQAATNLQPAQQVVPNAQGGIQIIPFGQQQAETTPVGGDVVIGVDGQEVRSFDDLLTYVALDTEPGQTIELTVLRNGSQVTVPVTLGQRPASGQSQQQE